ncbi:50S ribosomal protein L18 [Nymphaea thermarum]|nr:50S ribosomal protein L18 [Nymphaea thermarum]
MSPPHPYFAAFSYNQVMLAFSFLLLIVIVVGLLFSCSNLCLNCFCKFNGTSRRPRLSVFCSGKQLYAVLVDDQNKKCLFCGSTLQKSMRESHDKGTCSTMEAAKRVGEELVKTCIRQKIHEISSYDRNGFSRGERMKAFEYAVIRHGFIPPWKSDGDILLQEK